MNTRLVAFRRPILVNVKRHRLTHFATNDAERYTILTWLSEGPIQKTGSLWYPDRVEGRCRVIFCDRGRRQQSTNPQESKTMPLFYDLTFADGAWAGALKGEIARLQFIPGWRPKARIRRNSWHQWIQFEPDGWSGPFFWHAKPALRASATTFFVGCCVERGLSQPTGHINSAEILSPGWHWHGFYRCLNEQNLREKLNALMLNLPQARRSLWISSKAVKPEDAEIHYEGITTLNNAKAIIDVAIGSGEWINVTLGNSFGKAECLTNQTALVPEFRNPIVRAHEIQSLIESAMPHRLLP